MTHTQKITTDDALLMAYAAGELDGEEQDRLKARLPADPALSAGASQLQQDYRLLMQSLAQLDVENHAGEQAALRQVNRLMQQWHGIPKQPAISAPRWYWRLPAWSYAAAAAVALVVGVCFWWAYSSPPTGFVEGTTTTQSPAPEVTPAPGSSTVQVAQMPLAFQTFSSDDAEQLADLEQDVNSLSHDSFSGADYSGETNQ